MHPKEHWEQIYSTRNATEVSWYQPEPRISLEMIEAIAPDRGAAKVKWFEADALTATIAEPVDVWPDRAVFHFLTDASDRRKYVEQVGRAVKRGGYVLLATFGYGLCRH